jgi:hypothetical protein
VQLHLYTESYLLHKKYHRGIDLQCPERRSLSSIWGQTSGISAALPSIAQPPQRCRPPHLSLEQELRALENLRSEENRPPVFSSDPVYCCTNVKHGLSYIYHAQDLEQHSRHFPLRASSAKEESLWLI